MHVRGVSTCTQSFIPRQLKNDDAAGSILAARQKGNLALALDMAAIVFYVVAVIVVIAASVTSSSERFQQFWPAAAVNVCTTYSGFLTSVTTSTVSVQLITSVTPPTTIASERTRHVHEI